MAWTQADYETLKAAVASGISTVSYAGPPARTISYQSLAEMRSLLAEMTASLAAAVGRTHFRHAVTNRGFRSGWRGSFRRNE